MACHRASRVQLHGRGSPTSRLPAHGGHGVRSSYGSISGRTRQDATNTGNAVRREIHVMCRVWLWVPVRFAVAVLADPAIAPFA